MISKVIFKKYFEIQTQLKKYTDIYAIESEIHKGLVYGISDGKFAILRGNGAIFCPLHETPQLAERVTALVSKKMGQEVLDCYEDYMDSMDRGIIFGGEK